MGQAKYVLLVAGDSDFISAMKLVRIEGVLITVVL
jgi:uncharacterized LabA/DUF88 family protein